jgi:hypothetical protein
MATNARNRRLEPAYKQHTAVGDKVGVILDVEITTGQTNEGDIIEPQVDRSEASDRSAPERGDRRCGSRVPMRRFRYDAKHDILKCPKGCILRPKRPLKYGRFFYASAKDCGRCPIKVDCLSKGRANKAVAVGDDYPALLRARRRRERWNAEDRRLYQRHRWRSEGFHGEAKSWHRLGARHQAWSRQYEDPGRSDRRSH